jgi:hypothetical protein
MFRYAGLTPERTMGQNGVHTDRVRDFLSQVIALEKEHQLTLSTEDDCFFEVHDFRDRDVERLKFATDMTRSK